MRQVSSTTEQGELKMAKRTKNTKAASTPTKKSSYDPKKAKAQREAAKARKVKILSLEADRTDALEDMANAVMKGDLSAKEITAMGEATRDQIGEIDSEIALLRTAIRSGGERGFDKVDDKLVLIVDEDIKSLVSGEVVTVANESGFFTWTVYFGETGLNVIAGSSFALDYAIKGCRAAGNFAKKMVK